MRFIDRLKEKVQKENLWFYILILLAQKERYGFELRELINERFGFWSGNVTAYRVLYDLERSNLVTAATKDRRRYYTITGAGKAELEGAKEFLRNLLEDVK